MPHQGDGGPVYAGPQYAPRGLLLPNEQQRSTCGSARFYVILKMKSKAHDPLLICAATTCFTGTRRASYYKGEIDGYRRPVKARRANSRCNRTYKWPTWYAAFFEVRARVVCGTSFVFRACWVVHEGVLNNKFWRFLRVITTI